MFKEKTIHGGLLVLFEGYATIQVACFEGLSSGLPIITLTTSVCLVCMLSYLLSYLSSSPHTATRSRLGVHIRLPIYPLYAVFY